MNVPSWKKRSLDGWQLAVMFCCLCFSVCFILNTHPSGDGNWFWYAWFWRHGVRMYRDMHLPLQPLFVLLTAGTQAVFGTGWLASKTLALAQGAMLIAALWYCLRASRWNGFEKAALLGLCFFLTILTPYYRFDDYHITAHAIVLFSIGLLLRLWQQGFTAGNAVTLGVLCGAACTLRLNDGFTLLASSLLILLVSARPGFLKNTAVTLLSALGSSLLVLLCTRDNLHDWMQATIVHAASMKGGTQHMLQGPLVLPLSLWRQAMFHGRSGVFLYFVLLSFALSGAWLAPLRRTPRAVQVAVTVVGLALLALGARPFVHALRQTYFPGRFVEFGLIVFIVIAIILLLTMTLKRVSGRQADMRLLMLLVPLGQLVSGAMTSGGTTGEAPPAFAAGLILIPALLDGTNPMAKGLRRWLVVAAVILVPNAAWLKIQTPYVWHHYKDVAMFQNRTWYHHPAFGPMYIEKDQLAVFQELCAPIEKAGGDLLALPVPYPNYFCNVPSWKLHVQTWYDTSGKLDIAQLQAQLEAQPPRWIVYQRAPDTLHSHEVAFLGGKPAPHRALDRFILQQVANGAWTVRDQLCLDSANWILLETVPAGKATPPASSFPVRTAQVCGPEFTLER